MQLSFDDRTYLVTGGGSRIGKAVAANLAMFLLSDAAGWITGQVLNLDGGHCLRRGPDFAAILEPVFGADGLGGVG